MKDSSSIGLIDVEGIREIGGEGATSSVMYYVVKCNTRTQYRTTSSTYTESAASRTLRSVRIGGRTAGQAGFLNCIYWLEAIESN